jgi:hypothetical protein
MAKASVSVHGAVWEGERFQEEGLVPWKAREGEERVKLALEKDSDLGSEEEGLHLLRDLEKDSVSAWGQDEDLKYFFQSTKLFRSS